MGKQGTSLRFFGFFCFLVFYGSSQWYKYGMRLNTQRISGHMFTSALEYAKSSAPHCLQTIYHLKQNKKQQNLQRRKKAEKLRLDLAQNRYFLWIIISSPLSFISIAAPTFLQGCPIRAQICRPTWGVPHGLTWDIPSSACRFKWVLCFVIPCCFHPMFSSSPCLFLY